MARKSDLYSKFEKVNSAILRYRIFVYRNVLLNYYHRCRSFFEPRSQYPNEINKFIVSLLLLNLKIEVYGFLINFMHACTCSKLIQIGNGIAAVSVRFFMIIIIIYFHLFGKKKNPNIIKSITSILVSFD